MRYTIRLCYLFIDLFFCVAPVLSQEKKKANAALTDFSTIEQYQNVITPSLLATHLYYLASDEMQGRETGSAGQKLAAKYLAAQYRLLGIQPKGTIKKYKSFFGFLFFSAIQFVPHHAKEKLNGSVGERATSCIRKFFCRTQQ
jgi:hypothetical protein